MGGLINPSKPKSTAAVVASAAPVTAETTAAAAAKTEQETRQRRVEAVAKQRSGRAGTIATRRGLLVPTDWTSQRKSLLRVSGPRFRPNRCSPGIRRPGKGAPLGKARRRNYDFALPTRDSAVRGASAGARRWDKIFDGTAPDAVDQLAAN